MAPKLLTLGASLVPLESGLLTTVLGGEVSLFESRPGLQLPELPAASNPASWAIVLMSVFGTLNCTGEASKRPLLGDLAPGSDGAEAAVGEEGAATSVRATGGELFTLLPLLKSCCIGALRMRSASACARRSAIPRTQSGCSWCSPCVKAICGSRPPPLTHALFSSSTTVMRCGGRGSSICRSTS